MAEQVKRVAVMLPSMVVGGAERLVAEELSVLKDDPRFAMELHLVFEEGPFFQKVASLGLPVRVWNAPHKSIRMFKTHAGLIRHLRKTRCDILHTHLMGGVGPIVGRLAGAKVVATAHNDRAYGFIDRAAYEANDLVLACSKQVLRNIGSFVPFRKVGLLNNAIREPDTACLQRSDALKEFGFNERSRLVVSLGRLTRQKGYDVLIEAFRRVVADVPEAALLIGGEGEEKARLIDLVKSAGLQENIRLPGMVNEINEVLTACDLYVNSSRWEGLPMSLLEAIAHGKPMVATAVGGNTEVVLDGITGFLVPPEDPERLSSAIIRMLKDDDFRKKAGNEASDLFKREYTIERHCEALANYYSQVLHQS